MFIVPITRMQPIEAMQPMGSIGVSPAAGAGGGINVPFSDVLSGAIQDAQDLQKISNQDAYDLAMGRTDNLASMMINSTQAATAMELAVQVTGKAINAYREIMQMQV